MLVLVLLGPLGLFDLFEETVKCLSKLLKILVGVEESRGEGDVEVGNKAVDMNQKGVAFFVDSVDLYHGTHDGPS